MDSVETIVALSVGNKDNKDGNFTLHDRLSYFDLRKNMNSQNESNDFIKTKFKKQTERKGLNEINKVLFPIQTVRRK